MNFNEAVRTFQMDSSSPNHQVSVSGIPTYNSSLMKPKRSFHSRSNTISDDEIAIGLKTQKHSKPIGNTAQIVIASDIIPTNNNSNSDTYDDDIDTETEDYFSSNENEEPETETNSKRQNQSIGIKLFDANCKKVKKRKIKLHKSKSRDITLNKSNHKRRPRTQSDHTTHPTFLALPNHINESDENDTYNYDEINNNLKLPKIGTNKMHTRSYSESNIQKNIQKNQWPSSPSSDESFDVTNVDNNSALYTRFVSMKKKYKKQRRISRQFQDAITMIQDNNEDSIQLTEQQIKEQFEKEYEMKLIELEHDKLNQTITIEDKMKDVLIQNDQLMLQNKLLQQQVAAQVAMIQEQQQMAFEQQRHFVRMHSGDTNNAGTSPSTPVLGQFPSTQAILRRVSSDSTIPMLPPNSNINISAATNKNLSLNRAHSGALNPNFNFNNGHLGLTPHSSMGSVNTFDNENYTLNDDIHSINTDNSMINVGDINNKNNPMNMEPNYYKYNIKKKYKKKMKKKLKQYEQKLLNADKEAQEFVGNGQTPWDRFVNLMTPSFCSCSPAVVPQKGHVDQLL